MSRQAYAAEPTSGRLDLEIARQRQRPVTDFGTVMRRGLQRSASAIQSHTGAGYMLPGGALLSAAISGAGRLAEQLPAPTASVGPMLSAADASSGGGGSSWGDGGKGGSGGSGDLMAATERMHQRNQEFSMNLLGLQDKFATDAQRTSFLSNILKKRDQSITNIVQNVR